MQRLILDSTSVLTFFIFLASPIRDLFRSGFCSGYLRANSLIWEKRFNIG